jgi:uncharacterized membrane protein
MKKGKIVFSVFIAILLTSQFISAFGLSVFIPDKYQEIQAGETLQFQIAIKNVEKIGRHDIRLDYQLKKGNIILNSRRELKAIETQASFLSSIRVPEEAPSGMYTIEVIVNEEEKISATFNVKSSEIAQIKMYLIVLIAAVLLVGVMITWQLHRLAKKR